MNIPRIRKLLLWLVGAIVLYALVGFALVPSLVQRQAVAHVEQELGHELALGEVRFNPFTLAAEIRSFDLREPGGASLVSFKRLFIDFQLSSLFRRAWTFSALEVDAPAARFELRPDGSHNFSRLLAKLRQAPPDPSSAMPRVYIERIRIGEGRIDLADLQAAADARLTLHPISFELSELSTLSSASSPYKLSARSADGELIQWGGDITLEPFASTGKLALQNWKLATLERLLGKRIGLASAAGQLEITLDYRAAYTQGAPSFTIADARVAIDALELSASAGTPPLATLRRLVATGGAFDLAQRTVAVDRIELQQGAIDFAIDERGRPNWAALLLQPIGEHGVATTTTAEASPPPNAPADAQHPAPAWTVKLPRLSVSDLAVGISDKRTTGAATLSFAQGSLALGLQARIGAQGVSASVDGFTFAASAVSLAQSAAKLALDGVDLSVATMTFGPKDGHPSFGMEGLRLGLRAVAAQQGTRAARIDTLNLDLPSATAVWPQAADSRSSVRFDSPRLDLKGFGARTDAKKELVEAQALLAQAKLLVLEGGESVAVTAQELRAGLDHLLVREPAGDAALVRVGRIDASGGTLASAQRSFGLERLALSDVHASATYARNGKLDWDALVGTLVPNAEASKPAPSARAEEAKAAAAPPWNIGLALVEVNKLAAVYTDQRQQPAVAIAFQDVSAKLRNARSLGKNLAALELAGRIKDGGRFRAAGRIDPSTYAADLELALDGISLTPAQPFIAERARLQLVSALASAKGRLRYGRPKEAGAEFVYEGMLGLDKVILEETEPAQPFLSLDTLRATQMKLTLRPNSVDVPDLRLNRLITKLLIAEDQSVNLMKVLRPPPERASQPTAAATAAKPVAKDSDAAPFPISVARIRLDNSVLEFEDLSLRPQLFSTRMHELQGVVTGVSTSREARARLELDARVDEFGAAIIRGAMNPFKPREFTAVDLDFRNIAMTSLTPYSSKFAGYRIAAGTLTMHLQYRVKNSALQGDNRIVLDKLELGERVDSPSALDLPLELAIAILKDSDGRIDIGLPVSGSLDDPQFSIAGLVWKAIGNLLTRIVTAPFRALANLFGGGSSENLGAIEFDAGSEALRPPERQKLRTVAEALYQRPQLKLTVKPGYASGADRQALKSLSVRRELLARAGIQLAPGESPGLLDVGNARMQQAIDALFVERFGLPAARDLRAALAKPAAAPANEEAKPAAPAPGLQAIRIARNMSERLIDAAEVSDSVLSALAQRRGTAVLGELRDAGKIDPARLAVSDPKTVEPKDGAVWTELDLSVAK